MSVGFAIGMILGLAIGLVFGLFKLVVLLACEISKIAASSVVRNVKNAAEVQPSFKTREA